MRFFGKPSRSSPYLPLGQRVADEAVTALRRLVQEGTDIDHIVLAGGGAFFFADARGSGLPDTYAHCRSGRVPRELQGVPDRGVAGTAAGTAPCGIGHDRKPMTSRRSAAPTPREQGTPRPQTLVLTVRLFPNVYPALVAEFTNVGRRLRATRAAQLMMVGLLQEQAHVSLQRSAREGAPPRSTATSRGTKARAQPQRHE